MFNLLTPRINYHLISPYIKENDLYWKKLVIVKQILLVSTLGNVERTVWRICILMLGWKSCGYLCIIVLFLYFKILSNSYSRSARWIWITMYKKIPWVKNTFEYFCTEFQFLSVRKRFSLNIMRRDHSSTISIQLHFAQINHENCK